MRKILFVILVFFTSISLVAQSKHGDIADSLLQKLDQAKQVEKILIYNKLSDYYYDISIKKYQDYNMEALQLARELEVDSLIAKSMLKYGISFHQIGELNKSIIYYDTALQYYMNENDTLGEMKTLRAYGGAIYAQHRYSRAFEYFLRGLDLAEAKNSHAWRCEFLDVIARIYLKTEDFENAKLYYDKLLRIANKSGSQVLKAMAHGSLGNYYMRIGRYVETLENLNQSLHLYSLNNKKKEIIGLYVDFGNYYISMQNFSLAMNNYQKALQSSIEINLRRTLGTIYTKIAHTHALMENPEEALSYNKKALQSRIKYGDLALTSSSLINIGTSYMHQGIFDSATYYLEKGKEIANSIQHSMYLREAYYKLYLLEEKKANYRNALDFYHKFIEYRDMLQAQERNKEIAELKAKYDIYDKETELELQQLILDKQENRILLLIAGAMIVVLISAFLFFLYRNKKKASDQYFDLSRILEKKFEKRSLELKEKENQFQNLVEQIPMGVYRTTVDGKIEFANNALFRMLGYASVEDIKKIDLEDDVSYKGIRDDFKIEIKKKGEVKNLESIWNRADGSTIFVSEYARAVKDENGVVLHYEGVVEDITQRKKAEKELKEALEKSKDSDRLKSAFLATMQHELRTPLNGILGFSEILKDDEGIDEGSREYINLINDSGQHLLNIINDILDISTITAGKVKLKEREVNLNEIINNAVDTVKNRMENDPEKSNIKFELNKDIDDDKALIYADPKRLGQILKNLLDNAYKFTYEGKVSLSYRLNEIHDIVFEISDTGIGIPKNKTDIIFEQFRQIEDTDTRQYGGSGLGLAICKNLVNLMNGEIWVKSKPGEGSKFYFTIPFKSTKINESTDEDVVLPKKSIWSSHKLLIAEDNYSNFLLLKTFLRKTAIKILYAKNGEEAIHLYERNPDISLVLMDIQLPGISGYKASEDILKIDKNAMIIAVTAYAKEEDKERALESGCVDYISKPLRKETLMKKIGDIIGNE